jgi:cyclase
MEMQAYLEHVREEAMRCFERGLTSLQAAKQIDLGPYGGWRGPARLYANVERAYREFRHQPADAPWDMTATFDAIYEVARVRRCKVEF